MMLPVITTSRFGTTITTVFMGFGSAVRSENNLPVGKQDPNSTLSKQGRSVCQRIEEMTGIPTYYYLFNYRKRTRQQDLDSKCPLTGKEWLLEEAKRSDFMDFRCEDSRLVSVFTIKQ